MSDKNLNTDCKHSNNPPPEPTIPTKLIYETYSEKKQSNVEKR